MDLLLIAASATELWGTTKTVLQVAFGLGLVIFVHELGHFAVAKWCGVRCDKFYLGFDIFGLKLLKFQWGETEYGIGALPLGGYVKMLGQDDNPNRMQDEFDQAKVSGDLPAEPTSSDDGSVTPQYDPRSYVAKSVPQRMAIISAGVIMNLIFAYIVVACCYRAGLPYEPCVVTYVAPGAPAWEAGLRNGDEILEIDGTKKPYFVDDLMQRTALVNLSHGLDLLVSRPGEDKPFHLNVKPQESKLTPGRPTMGLSGPRSNQLWDKNWVFPESPAARAKPEFKAGDTVVAINGKPVSTYAEAQRELSKNRSEPIKIVVRRKPREDKSAVEGAADEKGEEVSMEVAPWPLRTLGLIMKTGPIVGVQRGSPAEAAGLKIDDQIIKIDGESPGDPLMLAQRMRQRVGEKVQLTIKRSAEKEPKVISVTPQQVEWYQVQAGGRISIDEIGVALPVENAILEVVPGSPADKAGLKANDELTVAEFIPANDERKKIEEEVYRGFKMEFEYKEQPLSVYCEFMDRVQNSLNDTTVKLTVKGGRTVTITPIDSSDGFDPDRGLSFAVLERIHKAESWGEAFSLSRRKTWYLVTLVYRTLQKLVTGQVSIFNLGGPVTIAMAAGQAASGGMVKFFMFLAMLSANLAVINFLPIPLLDGGHMLLLTVEGITGKPVPEKYAVKLQYLGLAFILGLMVLVFSLDGMRLFNYFK